MRVSTWVWAKSAGFTQHESRKRQLHPAFLHARGAWEKIKKHVLGAWLAKSCPRHFSHALGTFLSVLRTNLQFSVVFRSSSSNNLRPYFGNRISPICKTSEASWIFTILQMFLICRFAWFLVNYFNNPLKLLYFGKNRIIDSNIENITKVPKS